MHRTAHETTTAVRRARATGAGLFLLTGCALGGLTACSDSAVSAQPSATAPASGQASPAATSSPATTGGTVSGPGTGSATTSTGDAQRGTSPAASQGPSTAGGSGAPDGGSGRVIDLRATRPALVALASPSGQIVCTLSAGAAGPTIRCDVAGAAWKVPADDTCVGGNRGDSATTTPQSTALTCHTDTILGAARVGRAGTEWLAGAPTAASRATLPYGTTLLVTDTAGCTSRATGMTCWSGTHRFSVSRDSYSLGR